MDVRVIGESLGASIVVEGSVRRRNDRVRVTTHLTEVATGLNLWSGTLEREAKDAWVIQQDVAKAVVEAVHVQLTRGEQRRIAKRHTDNACAFELYLKGSHALSQFEVRAQREALTLFEAAVAADPGYPLPLLAGC